MAWSFDKALGTDKDWVRFLIGDTNSSRALVDDETIEAVLGAEPNRYIAAAEICEYIVRGLTAGGALEDRKVGEVRIRYRRTGDLLALAARLRLRGSAHMKPSAGGVYQSDTDSYNADTSLDRQEIGKGMFNNPAVGSVSNTTS